MRSEKDGALGWIVFDQPSRRNAVSAEMWRQIPAAVEAFAKDDDVRVVVMRGEGETAFVSGADISEFEERRAGSSGAGEYDRVSGLAFRALTGLEKPLVAMIHGFCVGGGVGIALTADLRFAADDARFAIPAARLGPRLLRRPARAAAAPGRPRARARDPLHRAALPRRRGARAWAW